MRTIRTKDVKKFHEYTFTLRCGERVMATVTDSCKKLFVVGDGFSSRFEQMVYNYAIYKAEIAGITEEEGNYNAGLAAKYGMR